MAKAEWGAKRQCPNCGAKFYDLNKSHPITCPKCAHQFEADVLLKPRKAKLDLKDAAPAVVAGRGDEELADAEAETEEVEEAGEEEEAESDAMIVEEELDDTVTADVEEGADIEDDVVIEDDDDIDETLIEADEDLGDEEVVEIPDPEEEKDL